MLRYLSLVVASASAGTRDVEVAYQLRYVLFGSVTRLPGGFWISHPLCLVGGFSVPFLVIEDLLDGKLFLLECLEGSWWEVSSVEGDFLHGFQVLNGHVWVPV